MLRMDWAREEAERKARLARQAQRLAMELEEDDLMLDELEGPSPTEERELEDLVRLHEEMQAQRQGQEEDMMGDLDDEDYDQLFMEVVGVSQEQQQVQQEQEQNTSGILWPQQGSGVASGILDVQGTLDETMDMS